MAAGVTQFSGVAPGVTQYSGVAAGVTQFSGVAPGVTQFSGWRQVLHLVTRDCGTHGVAEQAMVCTVAVVLNQ